jgi:hypothetical protein
MPLALNRIQANPENRIHQTGFTFQVRKNIFYHKKQGTVFYAWLIADSRHSCADILP